MAREIIGTSGTNASVAQYSVSQYSPHASVQMSDGSVVSLAGGSSGTYQLIRTSNRAQAPTVIVANGSGPSQCYNGGSLCRDDVDNIYFVGTSSTTGSFWVQVYVKGGTTAAPTWTLSAAGTTLFSTGQTTYGTLGTACRWVNTGTNGGRLVATVQQVSYNVVQGWLFDLPNKTGGAPTGSVQSNFNGSTNSSNFAGYCDLSQDGFGSNNVLMTYPADANFGVGFYGWTVGATGAPTTSQPSTLATNTSAGARAVYITRVAAGRWVIFYLNSGLNLSAAAYSMTAQVAAPVQSSMAFAAEGFTATSWTGYADPRVNGKAWVLARSAGAAGTTTFARLGVTLSGTTLTWDAATTTDDTVAVDGSTYTVTSGIRAAHSVTTPTVDWSWTGQNSGATSFITALDYTNYNSAPNAPTWGAAAPADGATIDRTQALSLPILYSDPDVGDTQAGYDLQVRVTGTTAFGQLLGGPTAGSSATLSVPGGTLAGRVDLRARTYDPAGAVGAWGPVKPLVALDPASAASTAPARTDPLAVEALAAAQNALVVAQAATGTAGGITPGSIGAATQSDVQVFTASGTWTMPSGSRAVEVICIGGGAGGTGSGANAGGHGGGYSRSLFPASGLTSTVAVTVGAGGAGSTTSTINAGSTSSFGSYAGATGGTSGAPGYTAGVNMIGNSSTDSDIYRGGQGGSANNPGNQTAYGGGGGGGSGGGAGGNAGGIGGSVGLLAGPPAGTSAAPNGVSGTSRSGSGLGGTGGSGCYATSGSTGGNGGIPGGGGGGASGVAGGNGARGEVIVISHF